VLHLAAKVQVTLPGRSFGILGDQIDRATQKLDQLVLRSMRSSRSMNRVIVGRIQPKFLPEGIIRHKASTTQPENLE
jgi:hypothetical protein